MKYTFVLDESVILFAQNFSDQYGNEDFKSAHLVISIADNCHKIAINDYLTKKYYEKTSDIERIKQAVSFKVIRILKYMLKNPDKNVYLAFIPNYPFENEIPSDDLPIVKTAVRAQAIFVTADGRLRQKIEELELPQRHNIKVLYPEEALTYAQQKDP